MTKRRILVAAVCVMIAIRVVLLFLLPAQDSELSHDTTPILRASPKYVTRGVPSVSNGYIISPHNPPSVPKSTKDKPNINIVYASDAPLFVGMMASMKSMIRQASESRRLYFYLVTDPSNVHQLQQVVLCMLKTLSIEIGGWIVIPFELKDYAPNLIISFHRYDLGNLASPLNYVRFYLPKLLFSDNMPLEMVPNNDKVIYLDPDTIVHNVDIGTLFDSALSKKDTNNVIAMVKRNVKLGGYGINFENGALLEWNRRHNGTNKEIKAKSIAYNAGVLVMDMKLWEDTKITSDVEYWIMVNSNSKEGLYTLGSNPPLLLSTIGRVENLDTTWNLDTAQHNFEKDLNAIIHWNGPPKPWEVSTKGHNVWIQYHTSHCFQ